MENSSSTMALLGLLVMVPLVITMVAFIVSSIYINWKLYSKAGQRGWACIVPVYSSVIMARIGKKPEWMGWVAGIGSVASSSMNRGSEAPANDPAALGVGLVGILLAIVFLVFTVILLVGFIQQYRHAQGQSTTAFWLCYFLLPIAAVFMLKNIVYKATAPELASTPSQPGQQPAPPYVPPVA